MSGDDDDEEERQGDKFDGKISAFPGHDDRGTVDFEVDLVPVIVGGERGKWTDDGADCDNARADETDAIAVIGEDGNEDKVDNGKDDIK
ncbi:hypothetical protein Acr_28g0011550 [Actinidia rufa]|uniref:Uncharacterized protein n=1 Tax=Actinidia rufa TaxID=165716 RepID=A0A7J0HBH1_9ERIC|nr:hypothetical protein Acr_28g0011550 [Actinidia rufa]